MIATEQRSRRTGGITVGSCVLMITRNPRCRCSRVNVISALDRLDAPPLADKYLWASSTTRTFPVLTSERTNSRVTISNKLQAEAASTNGSDKSMIVSCPHAKRGAAAFFCCLERWPMKVSSSEIRCFRPATCAGLKSRARFSNSRSKASIVKSSPNSRRIDCNIASSQ